jgi:hypothetical protein
MIFLQLFKPFLYIWASLNFIDDISVIMKIFRLVGASTFNRREENPETICNLCDDLMENILRGSEGLEAVPCSWICLRTTKCTQMCRYVHHDSFAFDFDSTIVSSSCLISSYRNASCILIHSLFLPHSERYKKSPKRQGSFPV